MIGLVRVGQTDDVDQPWWDQNERTDVTGTKRPNELVTVGHIKATCTGCLRQGDSVHLYIRGLWDKWAGFSGTERLNGLVLVVQTDRMGWF